MSKKQLWAELRWSINGQLRKQFASQLRTNLGERGYIDDILDLQLRWPLYWVLRYDELENEKATSY